MSLFGRDTYNYINNEIDYDKLEKAIVKAYKELENEKQEKSKVLISAMALFIAVLFAVIFVVIGFFIVAFVSSYISLAKDGVFSQLEGITAICVHVLFWLFVVALLVTAIVMLISTIEVYREKDRDFIMSAFSGVVGFAALLIALVALLFDNSTEIMEILLRIESLLQV